MHPDSLAIISTVNLPATASTAFIGFTEKAQSLDSLSLFLQPTTVTSYPQYQQLFGQSTSDSLYLSESLQLYFKNGGTKAIIVSVGNFSDSSAGGTSVSARLQNGLEVIKQIDDVALIVSPDAVNLSLAEQTDHYQQLLNYCADSINKFAILDLNDPFGSLQSVNEFRTALGTNALEYGAAYSPWLVTIQGKSIPPSGAIAGIYAKNDQQRGVWKAPANYSVQAIQNLSYDYSDSEMEALTNDPLGNKSINGIKTFANRGTLVWGARTLNSNSEWKYVPARRFANSLQESVYDYLETLQNTENNSATWEMIDITISNFLNRYWREGAFPGSQPKESYFVNVGLGSTMTQTDIDKGQLKVIIGFATVKPAEFVVLPFQIQLNNN